MMRNIASAIVHLHMHDANHPAYHHRHQLKASNVALETATLQTAAHVYLNRLADLGPRIPPGRATDAKHRSVISRARRPTPSAHGHARADHWRHHDARSDILLVFGHSRMARAARLGTLAATGKGGATRL